jgi:hypothetical protein
VVKSSGNSGGEQEQGHLQFSTVGNYQIWTTKGAGFLCATSCKAEAVDSVTLGVKSGPVLEQKRAEYHKFKYQKLGEDEGKYFRHRTWQNYANISMPLQKDLAIYCFSKLVDTHYIGWVNQWDGSAWSQLSTGILKHWLNLLALLVRERLLNHVVFIWSHVLRNEQQVVLWTQFCLLGTSRCSSELFRIIF